MQSFANLSEVIYSRPGSFAPISFPKNRAKLEIANVKVLKP